MAPNTQQYHIEDVHRAGGIMAILGELDRAGMLDTSVPTVYGDSLKDALEGWDIMRSPSPEVVEFYRAGPGGVPTQVAFSQSARWPSLDSDRVGGCIRDLEHAFSTQDGLAVLRGNIAEDGCVVKTAGVDDSNLVFEGPAHVVESQDQAVVHILEGRVREGEVIIIRYEDPKGGPSMQKMLYPTSYLKSKGLGKAYALLATSADKGAVRDLTKLG